MLQLRLQADEQQRDHSERMVASQSNNHLEQISYKIPKLKIASFDERVGSIEDYLTLFERQAVLNEIPDNKLSHVLGALLTGKAVAVYNELSMEELEDFETLKRALLNRYGLTEYGYRARFKGITP